MAITLAPDVTKRLQASIKRYVAEQLDQDIGDLQAGLLLIEFVPGKTLDKVGAASAAPTSSHVIRSLPRRCPCCPRSQDSRRAARARREGLDDRL